MSDQPDHFLRNDEELRYWSFRRISELRTTAKRLAKIADETESSLKRYFGVENLAELLPKEPKNGQ